MRAGTPPKVYRKNTIDLDNENISITITDGIATDTGEENANFVRDRKNNTGWGTTGSSDAANTIFQVLFGDEQDIDNLFLIGNNFKDFSIETFDGSIWTNLFTVSGNNKTTYHNEFTKLTAQGIRIIIDSTFKVDDDKFLSQFIVSEKLGQFQESPMVEMENGKNRKRINLVSGKSKIIQNSGAVEIEITHKNQINDNDLNLVEEMFNSYSGFLFWPCGGDEAQFRTVRIGFRRQDIFLMAPRNEYSNPWGDDSNYLSGTNYKLELVEVV